MKNTLETRLGIFVALAFITAVLVMEMAGGLDIFKKGRIIRARFNNVQELKPGDPVKMAGVEVGRVDRITLVEDKVEVTMKLTSDAVVKTDSKAVIKFLGLLGQNYIAVSFGSPNALKIETGAVLQTEEQPDLSALMAKLDSVASGVAGITTNLSGGSFNELLGPLTDFFKQNSPKLAAILGNLQTVSGQIAEGKGTVGKLVYDDALYNSALATVTNLNHTATDVQDVLAQAKATISQVNAGQGTLGRLLKDDTLYTETTATMTNLHGIFLKINQGQGSIGKLVNDEGLYRNVRLTLQKVERATEDLEDQGALSVLGTAAGKLF